MTLRNQKLFWQQFRKNFVEMGSILPSSPALGQAASAYLAQKQGPARILEAGSGTGSFTKEIIPLLSQGDILDLVEINPQLTAYLQYSLQNDPTFQPSSAVEINLFNADLSRFPLQVEYDYIIFSLPLTNFPPFLVKEILDLMIAHLKPGGIFSYVKYIAIGQAKYYVSGKNTKQAMAENKAIISNLATQYQFDRRVVMKNVPPTWVHYWKK